MKPKNKQTRGKRGSREQKSFLISFMEENIDFAQERFEGDSGAILHNDKWTELANQLNEMGDCRKTSEKWKQYWRDLKRSCRLKAAEEKKRLEDSGGNASIFHQMKFDDLEKRIINITIPDLVLEDECESQEVEVKEPVNFQISQVIKPDPNIITKEPPKRSETPIKRKTVEGKDNLLVELKVPVNFHISKVIKPDSNIIIKESPKTSEAPIKKRKTLEDKDNLLVKATRTMAEMSKITTLPDSDEEINTFGKFIISELRGIIAAGDQIVYRQAKRKIQEVLMNTWDVIDSLPRSNTRTVYSSDTNTSQWDDHNC